MLASVVMKQSIVAMLGWIIPAPLAMPPIVTLRPPTLKRMANSLRRVSVVMIALAASTPFSVPSLVAALSMPLRIFGIGSRVPIRPVEQTSHSRALVCVTSAACSIMALASAMPPTPVQALAQLELTTTPRIFPLRRVLHRDLDRRGLDRVRGEGRRDFRRDVRDDEREVLGAAALQAAGDARGLKAERGGDASILDDFGLHLKSSPVVSSRPQARFADWMACEALPLPRLSIAEKSMSRFVRASTRAAIWMRLEWATSRACGSAPAGSSSTNGSSS